MNAVSHCVISITLRTCLGTGFCVTCCTPCAYGQMIDMFNTGKTESSAFGETSACITYCGLGMVPYCGECIVANYAAGNRKQIRKKYGLKVPLPLVPHCMSCFSLIVTEHARTE